MKGNFQIILMVVFVALAILGILVFSGMIPIGTNNDPGSLGTVTIWGTDRDSLINPLLDQVNTANPTFVLKYVQKSPDTFDQDLIEALADGSGPDMLILPDSLAFKYSKKLYTLPFASYPLSAFKSNFATAGEVFLNQTGSLALPISIDPLVMYYNRSMLDANGIVNPPASWEDLGSMIPVLTKKDANNKITKSTIALGNFSNVDHAKDILATLFMQTGNNIVDKSISPYRPTLANIDTRLDVSPVLRFFVDFADPNKGVYSWNRSFSSSRNAFSSEDLAFYFGFGSELPYFVSVNPNQNFSIATFPQIKDSSIKVTGAHVNGLAVLISSKNINTAVTALGIMANGDFAEKYAEATGVAPARRDLLSKKPIDNAFIPTIYLSLIHI